jgi:two-component system, NarL family, nitrate/nitrite response regulator NarL
MSKIRLVVIDDHPLFRAGVIRTLESESDIAVVGEGSSAADALRLAKEASPSVILLDMSMAGGGLAAIRALLTECPEIKPLVLSGTADSAQVSLAMQSGAWGYVLKGVSGSELARSVQVIHRGERYVTPSLAACLFAKVSEAPAKRAPDPLSGLTSREEDILKLIVEGLSNKEIGGRLELSEKTVKHYLTIILDKLNVRNRVQAALIAYGRFKQADTSEGRVGLSSSAFMLARTAA